MSKIESKLKELQKKLRIHVDEQIEKLELMDVDLLKKDLQGIKLKNISLKIKWY